MSDDKDNAYFTALLALVPVRYTQGQNDSDSDAEDGDMQQDEPPKKEGKGNEKPFKKSKEVNPFSGQGLSLNPMEEKIQAKKKSKKKKKDKSDKDKSKAKALAIQKSQEKLRARIAERQAEAAKAKGKNQQHLTNGKHKPIVNSEGKLVFSKFDFTKSGGDKEKNSGYLGGKDFKRILAKLEQRDAKVAKLKETDVAKATALEHKHVWQDVMDKAKGVKVKDDATRLKKAVKRKEKMKEQRKKQWEGRKQAVETHQAKRQEKRQQNIQKRQDDKKAKHRKKLIKKGRILPGF